MQMKMIINLIDGYRMRTMATGQLDERDARAILRRSGLRETPQRLLVLYALANEPHDATAQELYERLRAGGSPIGLATVYRTLASLSESGAVDTFAHRRGELCFRLCSTGAHHHHLLCSGCHKVVEISDCDLDGWVNEIAAAHGFAAERHELEVTGVCSACRAPGTA
jgi:Fur family ferric uptake transcriptional regulator